MPLARYFALIGVALLVLLFIADACVTTSPVAEKADSNRIAIRIRSEMKLPERVVYDTSQPTIVVAPIANDERSTPKSTTTTADKTREAFAQFQPSDAARPAAPKARARETRPSHQHKATRRRAPPYEFMMARQAHFGWFGPSMW
ncbi:MULTISPECIES: hypothetical protein [unclassified Bradyrhizobium]|uniref:hypothetical protein n=1 Tax=unclassified Bradyrhizobium TaxID=2631580 RepID=UPI00040814C6|nr:MULTISPECIES: hypothetical protein [unclassified Bradyrhizobium]MCP3459435.1 hypothetical protein [Bradyrhizobium sp. CCGUVB23]